MAALAELRRNKAWTPEALSRAAGVPVRTIKAIEDGSQPSIEPRDMQQVAAALEVHPSEIDEFRSSLGLAALGETGSGEAAKTGSGEP